MKNKKGFTLIELLAVIIILGILMIIAIPSVTQYINNSRKSAYVDTAKEIIAGARNRVNQGDLEMFSTETTYYIPVSCIGTENGQKSPYGDFVDEETYVIVTYDGHGYEYYWVSRDATGQGVKTPTKLSDLDEDDIESDIELGKIIPTKISNSKATVLVLNNTCDEFFPAAGDEETAASTILTTAQTAGQLNQIQGTNIYIFKGGNPANYVKFNDEDWRIIGIYGDQLKIIKVSSRGAPTLEFGPVVYNSTTPNPGWAASIAKTALNHETQGYYSRLSSTAKAMIDASAEWNVGTALSNATAVEAFNTSVTTKWKGTDTSDFGVGLMASYEFLYASGGDGCQSVAGNVANFNIACGTATNDWLKPEYNMWTLTGTLGASGAALGLYIDGLIGSADVYISYALDPAVFLKSTVKVTGGTGVDPEHAYTLSLN